MDTQDYVSYLLGALPPEEEAAIELRFLSDDDAFEELNAVEDELVRDYVTGSISDTLKARFEARCRERPALAEKVQLQFELLRTLDPSQRTANTRWRAQLLVAACMAGAIGALWLWADLQGRDPSAEPAVRELAFVLLPGGTRAASDRQTSLWVPESAETVELSLILAGEPAPVFVASLRTVGGREVWRGETTPVAREGVGAHATIRLSARLLESEDYILSLSTPHLDGSLRIVASYVFRIGRS